MEFIAHLNEFYQIGKQSRGVKKISISKNLKSATGTAIGGTNEFETNFRRTGMS